MKSAGLLLATAAVLLAIAMGGYSTTRADIGERAQDPPISTTEGYNIAFERTVCLGNCPAFTLLIDGEGNVRLTMAAFQENPPEPYEEKTLLYGMKLSPRLHLALIAAIEQGGFRRLDADYSIMVTDSSSTMIAIDTPRGHWSTDVYAVPCEKRGSAWSESHRKDWGIEKFVPDIFCELAERLDAVACDTYLHGTPLGPNHDLKPFRPPNCRTTQ